MEKKTFVITGANRGLGDSLVELLLTERNIFVISLSRKINQKQLDYPSSIFHHIECDLLESNLKIKLKELNSLIGNEEVYFINNANIIEPISRVEDFSEKSFDEILTINIKSPIIISQFLLNNFKDNKINFINISSGSSKTPTSNWSLYCSTKSFMEMFFNVLKTENNRHEVISLDPGAMDTDMQKYIRKINFPDSNNFNNLFKKGKLKSTEESAKRILEQIL